MDQTIVVGIDGSSASRAAIRWAIERAQSTSDIVELLYVVDDEWGAVGDRFVSEMHPPSAHLLQHEIDYAISLSSTVSISGRVLHGDPMVELGDASNSATMVVLGTHKTGFIHGQAFGSRSLQLAAMAHAPVAVVPESSTRSRRGIVVGVDDSAAGWAAILFGATESYRTGQQLTLLHAALGEGGWDGSQVAGASSPHGGVESRAIELAKSYGAVDPIRTRTVRRPAAEALVDASAASALLVIGSSRRRAVNIAALGPVSHDVLLNLSGPVLVVHGDRAAQVLQPTTQRRSA